MDFKLELVGTDGVAYVDTFDQMVRIAGAEAMTYPGTLDWTESRLATFLDRLDGAPGDHVAVALDDGVENVRMLVALHEALERRSPVEVGR